MKALHIVVYFLVNNQSIVVNLKYDIDIDYLVLMVTLKGCSHTTPF